MSKAKIEITRVHFGSALIKVSYTLNGEPMMISRDCASKPFEKAMKALIPHAITIKELPENAAENYRCNALSLTHVIKEKGENRTATIALTKTTTAGKADNLITPSRHYEAIDSKVSLLSEDTRLAIMAVCKQAKLFIHTHPGLRELYQSELDLEEAA